jgi:hypothetical protein
VGFFIFYMTRIPAVILYPLFLLARNILFAFIEIVSDCYKSAERLFFITETSQVLYTILSSGQTTSTNWLPVHLTPFEVGQTLPLGVVALFLFYIVLGTYAKHLLSLSSFLLALYIAYAQGGVVQLQHFIGLFLLLLLSIAVIRAVLGTLFTQFWPAMHIRLPSGLK